MIMIQHYNKMNILFADGKVTKNLSYKTRVLIEKIGETKNKETEDQIIK